MNTEPITDRNVAEVNEFLRRTGGKIVTAGWNGFIVRDDEKRIYGVYQHAQILVGSFHVDPETQHFKTAKFMMFCQDFCRAVQPSVRIMCAKDSPLFEPAKKLGLVDVTDKTAFMKLGES